MGWTDDLLLRNIDFEQTVSQDYYHSVGESLSSGMHEKTLNLLLIIAKILWPWPLGKKVLRNITTVPNTSNILKSDQKYWIRSAQKFNVEPLDTVVHITTRITNITETFVSNNIYGFSCDVSHKTHE